MSNKITIKNCKVVNEKKIFESDLLIQDGRIERIDSSIETQGDVIDAEGLYLLPGVIDDQVHFREPGLTDRGSIKTESLSAIAGGTTSFMDMPNVIPPTLTNELWKEKIQIASKDASANYSFYMGSSNTNIEEIDIIATNYDPKYNLLNKAVFFIKNILRINLFNYTFNSIHKNNYLKNEMKLFFGKNFSGKILNVSHHLSHALSTLFFLDDNSNSLVFSFDGSGDFSTIESFLVNQNKFDLIDKNELSKKLENFKLELNGCFVNRCSMNFYINF